MFQLSRQLFLNTIYLLDSYIYIKRYMCFKRLVLKKTRDHQNSNANSKRNYPRSHTRNTPKISLIENRKLYSSQKSREDLNRSN